MAEENKKNEDRPGWLERGGALIIALTAGIVATAAYLLNFGVIPSDAQDDWGQFGDFLGGLLNPIVALFALYMLSVTLRTQRRELRATHDELKASRIIADGQRKVMQRQLFESQFFNLIPLFAKAIERLRATSATSVVGARIRERPLISVRDFLAEVRELSIRDRPEIHTFAALLRAAANVLHTNESALDADEISNYSSVLRGFISDTETAFLLMLINEDTPGAYLETFLEKYRLCADTSTEFRWFLWNAPDRAKSLINRLAGNFLVQERG
ncbi:MAG TPA: hypothetical protein VFU13_00630 [Steroidobacteraceae bacterium]|nr:hypothetical protein [Steroidobacteraceae bacterium]